jgi:hypothetical protein
VQTPAPDLDLAPDPFEYGELARDQDQPNGDAELLVWGAQAASLHISAACRDASATPGIAELLRVKTVAGKLPATAGWQPALPT